MPPRFDYSFFRRYAAAISIRHYADARYCRHFDIATPAFSHYFARLSRRHFFDITLPAEAILRHYYFAIAISAFDAIHYFDASMAADADADIASIALSIFRHITARLPLSGLFAISRLPLRPLLPFHFRYYFRRYFDTGPLMFRRRFSATIITLYAYAISLYAIFFAAIIYFTLLFYFGFDYADIAPHY
jgi:hypothetical protein